MKNYLQSKKNKKLAMLVILLGMASIGSYILVRANAAVPKPTLANTGVEDGVTLTKQPGTTITQNGAVIQNIEYQGSVTVNANDVTLKNVRVIGNGAQGIKMGRGYKGLVMDHIEITCLPACQENQPGPYSEGIYGEDAWTLRNSELSGYPDGAKVHNNQLIENNYFHDNQRVLGSNGKLAHTDGLQTTGGSNNIIRNNVFATDTRTDFAMGSNMMVQNEFAQVTNWVIEGNYFSGGNFSTYFNDKDTGHGPHKNIIVRNNTFVKNSAQYGYTYPIGYGKQICYTDLDVKFINNTLDDGTVLDSCNNDPDYNPTPTDPTPSNIPPDVLITAPSAGSSYAAPATIPIAATATDADGTVAKVEFYSGSTKLGEDVSAPYTYSWTGVPSGSYTIIVKAIDDSGGTTSANTNVTVSGGTPTLTLQGLTDGQTVSGSIALEAIPNNVTNFVNVAFYVDNQLINSQKTPPICLYDDNGTTCSQFDISALANGNHTFKAVMTYDTTKTIEKIITVNVQNASTPPATKACDFNSSGTIDISDLAYLINFYQKTVTANTNGDCNGDGHVDLTDLAILIGKYGT